MIYDIFIIFVKLLSTASLFSIHSQNCLHFWWSFEFSCCTNWILYAYIWKFLLNILWNEFCEIFNYCDYRRTDFLALTVTLYCSKAICWALRWVQFCSADFTAAVEPVDSNFFYQPQNCRPFGCFISAENRVKSSHQSGPNFMILKLNFHNLNGLFIYESLHYKDCTNKENNNC